MERLGEQGFFLSLHTSVTRSEGQEFFLGLHTSVTSTTQWYLTHNRCLTITHQWNEWLLSEYINEQPGTERMVRNHWWIKNACMCQNSSQWPLSGRIEGNLFLFPLCVYPHDYCLFFSVSEYRLAVYLERKRYPIFSRINYILQGSGANSPDCITEVRL